MKNVQFTSRETDHRVLIALLCAGSAAIMGLCVPPPQSLLGDEWMYLFDVTICAILAMLVWSGFHLRNIQRFNGLPHAATIVGLMVVWLLLVIGVMILIRHVVANDDMFDLTTAILMKH